MKKQAMVDDGIGVFTQVRNVLAGKSPQVLGGPKGAVEDGDVVLGVLTDPVTKALFFKSEELVPRILQIGEAHMALHESGQDEEHDCRAFVIKIDQLEKQLNAFSSLFWLGVRSSFPVDMVLNCGIKQGWQVIGDKADGCVGARIFPEKNHPSNTLFADIRTVLTAEEEGSLSVTDPGLEPVDMRNEECRVGQIASRRLKALYLISHKLRNEMKGYIDKTLHTPLAPGKTLPQIIVEIKNKSVYMNSQLAILNQLFWLGVEEEIPATGASAQFSLRKDWTVVRVPQDESPLDQVLGELAGRILRKYE